MSIDRPHWTKSVPWWLGWLFVGGFGLAGAFGSTVLPVGFQLFAFTAGCAAMAVAACGTIVHFVNEHRINQNQLPLKLEPIHLILIGLLIAAAGVGWQWTRGAPGAVVNHAEQAATVAAQPPRTAKYYSRAEREELSDLCKQLRDVLIENGADGGGHGVYAKAANLHNDWLATTASSRNSPRAIAAMTPGSNVLGLAAKRLIEELNETRDSVAKFQELLFGMDGAVSKLRRAYPDESADIIGQRTTAESTGIQNISSNLAVFQSAITALDKASELGDQYLVTHLVISTQASTDLFISAVGSFQKWEFETVQRIDAFRKTQLSGS